MSFFFNSIPNPLSHLFPIINFSPFENLLIVSIQLFAHFPHLFISLSNSKVSSSSLLRSVLSVFLSHLSLAIIAAPYAPISPATSGLITFLPDTLSKHLKTASL